MMVNGESLHNYLLLRGALLRHQQLPWQLSETQQNALAHAAAREQQLVLRTLALPLADEVVVDSDSLQQAVETFIAGVASCGEIAQALDRAGIDAQTLRAAIAGEMMAAEVLERVSAMVAPSEDELYRWYQCNPDKFAVPERREAFQILITINNDFAENRRTVAQQRIEELRRIAQQTPDSFGQLALSHSECPSAVEGGRLGMAPRGHLYAELERELFALDSGAISTVVETSLGFHILRCGAIEPPRQLAWEEVKESLSRRLTQHRINQYLNRRVAEMLTV